MSPFSIDFQWLARDYGDDVARSTFADITIVADGWKVTEIEDLAVKTVRPGIRVSAYALAQWLASNWWRLLWEPERDTLSWRMSHKVGAAGEGYLWPDLTFSSDGEAVLVRGRPSLSTPEGAVRYLNRVDVSVPAREFEMEMHSFVQAVIGRLAEMRVDPAGLGEIWREVLVERQDPELTAWRKLEAILGYDPDEAAVPLINELQRAAREYGTGAVEEIAAESREKAVSDIKALWDESRGKALPLAIRKFDTLRARIDGIKPSIYAWQKAMEAARIARELLSLDPGPISTPTLAEVFEVDLDHLQNAMDVQGPMNAGFRDGEMDRFSVFLKSRIPVSRRFALLRLVGDHLVAPPGDKLLPAAPSANTQRQKFQRAFAQEFLCPYSDLVDYLGPAEPNDESIEDAARYFEVSPLLVNTILVNKGKRDRSCLQCH